MDSGSGVNRALGGELEYAVNWSSCFRVTVLEMELFLRKEELCCESGGGVIALLLVLEAWL